MSPLANTQRLLQQNTKHPEKLATTPMLDSSKLGYSSLVKTTGTFYKSPMTKQSPTHVIREEAASSSKKVSIKPMLKAGLMTTLARKK